MSWARNSRLEQFGWFAGSTGIIAVILYLTDFNDFLKHLQGVDTPVFLSAVVAGLLVIPIWTNSWYQLLNRMGTRISFFKAAKLFTAGNFLNSVTPLGQFGGEPLMAYVIRENTDISYEKAFSTVLSADMINAVPILTFIMGGSLFLLLFSGSMGELMAEISYMAAVILVLGGTISYLLWFRSSFIERKVVSSLELIATFTGKGEGYVREIEERLEEVKEAFSTVGEDPSRLLKITVIAHLFFVFQVFSLYLVMMSVGVETDFTPLYFVLPVAALANFSPTPGGSGTYEAVLAGLLTGFLGVAGSTAVTIAILYRFTTFWPGLLIGYLSITSLTGRENMALET